MKTKSSKDDQSYLKHGMLTRALDGYGLYWSGRWTESHADQKTNRVSLIEVYWYANLIKKIYPGFKKYLTKKYFTEMEHGKRLSTKIIDPNFQDFIVNYTVKS